MKKILIETTSQEPNVGEFLIDGHKIVIGKNDLNFFNKLRNIESSIKIKLMNISIVELENFVINEKTKRKSQLISLLSKEWFYKETGESIALEYQTPLLEKVYSQKELLKLVKSKKGLSYSNQEILINFFTGENREVYTNENI